MIKSHTSLLLFMNKKFVMLLLKGIIVCIKSFLVGLVTFLHQLGTLRSFRECKSQKRGCIIIILDLEADKNVSFLSLSLFKM